MDISRTAAKPLKELTKHGYIRLLVKAENKKDLPYYLRYMGKYLTDAQALEAFRYIRRTVAHHAKSTNKTDPGGCARLVAAISELAGSDDRLANHMRAAHWAEKIPSPIFESFQAPETVRIPRAERTHHHLYIRLEELREFLGGGLADFLRPSPAAAAAP